MKYRIKRLISQFIFLLTANLGAFKIKTGFCYPFFYCNACPAASSSCPLRPLELSVFKAVKHPDNFNWKLLLYPLVILGTVGILTGRAVCGWACPIGFLQRGTGKVAKALKTKYPKIKKLGKHPIEGYLRYTKYFVLIGFVFVTSLFIGFVFTDICPVGVLTGTFFIMALRPGVYVPASYFYVAMVVFSLFLILIFLIERGWCRYFCPIGALLAPFNKISFLHIHVNQKECIHCNLCSEVCPMGIDVANMNRDTECILCGKCVDACPKGLISFKRLKNE